MHLHESDPKPTPINLCTPLTRLGANTNGSDQWREGRGHIPVSAQERMLKQIVEISEEIALVERQLGISLPASQQTASKMLEEDVEQ
eukprot:4520610-Pyramimonas_sp.AAC.1